MARPISRLSANILKKLDHGALAMNDLFDFLVSRPLEGSAYRLSKKGYAAFKRRSWQRRVALNTEQHTATEKQRFYSLMYNLSNQGLVTKEKRGRKTIVSITKKGIEKYRTRKNPPQPFLAPPDKYTKIKSPLPIIISFDIPEKEAHKRAWLRSALRNLDYEILHESVWIGNNILPKELLEEARRMDMTQHIHIFSVLKKGTIAG